MVQDLTISPEGPRHESHRPAKAKGSPDFITTRMGLLAFPTPLPFVETVGDDQDNACVARAVRKLGRSVTVSARALIRRLPTEALLAQEGISPQCRYASCLALVVRNGQHRLRGRDVVPGRVSQVAGK